MLQNLLVTAQSKERGYRNQEKEWRSELNTVKADSATMRSHLKSKEAALLQATADLDELHKEAGQLKIQQDNRQFEMENLQSTLEAVSRERDNARAAVKRLTVEGGLADRRMSGANSQPHMSWDKSKIVRLCLALVCHHQMRQSGLMKAGGKEEEGLLFATIRAAILLACNCLCTALALIICYVYLEVTELLPSVQKPVYKLSRS